MFFFFAYLLAKFVFDYNCGIIIWELKRKVFEDADVDLIIPTDWLLNLVKESPILKA